MVVLVLVFPLTVHVTSWLAISVPFKVTEALNCIFLPTFTVSASFTVEIVMPSASVVVRLLGHGWPTTLMSSSVPSLPSAPIAQ